MYSAAELARRALAGWNAHDLDTVCDDWDTAIVVRPDRYYPDSGELVGRDAARRFWEDQRDAMGYGQMEAVEEHDLGDRCLVRVRQFVDTRSGIRSSYEWSYLTTASAGKIVTIEFFLKREHGLRAAGVIEQER